MGQNNYVTLISLLIFVAIAALFFRRWMVDALIEAINNFRGDRQLQCIPRHQMTPPCFASVPDKTKFRLRTTLSWTTSRVIGTARLGTGPQIARD